ncbi:nuclear transport factor 2 family protein [Nostoc sp. LEGE 12447]|uniref:nuclear transport factor 2 family protein n=1 Tax=Nostoc sp. LEGE 12447 TaxID=1828640 RepID=UPI0018847DA9|nr:nuclear transport factor 2 family protein [Nostoc sp. LEGE 12447]MBE9001373.1 nuclear transport factor 2 family protein [Nostoc sp. LEGE 12447]
MSAQGIITDQMKVVRSQLKSAEGEQANYDIFVSYFTEDATYQFSNFDVRCGRKAIRQIFNDLHPLVKGFSQVTIGHDIKRLDELGNKVFCEMYTLYFIDGEEKLRIPCFGVYTFEGDLIKSFKLFMDTSPLLFDTSKLIPFGKPYKGL